MRHNPPSPAPTPHARCIGVVSCTLAQALCCPAMAMAQTTTDPANPAPVAQVQPLTRFEAEQERLRQKLKDQPQGYQDKFFDSQTLQRIDQAVEAIELQPPGSRVVSAESRLETHRQNQSGEPSLNETGLGLRLEYRRETLNHGEWVLQTDTRRRASTESPLDSSGAYGFTTEPRSGERLTVRNLGLPITPRVLVDTSAGDITTEVTDGLTRGQQFSLGGGAVRGIGAHVFSRDFDARLGVGSRGQMTGGPYPGFEQTQGQVAWLGFTQRLGGLSYVAVQVNHAGEAPTLFTAFGQPYTDTENTTSVATAIGHGHTLDNDGDQRWRITLLHSRSTRPGDLPSRSASGAYLDGGVRHNRYRQEAGLYAALPSLQFGDQWVADGNRGLYWRMHREGLRFNWGLGISRAWQKYLNTALAGTGIKTGLNGYWVHRLTRQSAWGGNLQYTLQQRHNNNTFTTASQAGQRSTYSSLYYQDRWNNSQGDSRLRWTSRNNQALVSNGPNATGDEFDWEQDWWSTQGPGTQNPVLRTTLGWAKDRSQGDVQTYPTAGVTWQTWFTSGWNLNTDLRYTSRSGNLATSRGLAASVHTETSVARNWTLGASLLMNQAVVGTTTSATPEAGGGVLSVARSNDRSLWFHLRFEEYSGRPYGFGLRGDQGAGTGRISGRVFLDANRDGAQQADEPGVDGVEVFLNQRLRTTTDSQGRYEFAVVATGMQALSLRPESVPLPWGEGPRSRTTVEVPLRGTIQADLAVVKVSE